MQSLLVGWFGMLRLFLHALLNKVQLILRGDKVGTFLNIFIVVNILILKCTFFLLGLFLDLRTRAAVLFTVQKKQKSVLFTK